MEEYNSKPEVYLNEHTTFNIPMVGCLDSPLNSS